MHFEQGQAWGHALNGEELGWEESSGGGNNSPRLRPGPSSLPRCVLGFHIQSLTAMAGQSGARAALPCVFCAALLVSFLLTTSAIAAGSPGPSMEQAMAGPTAMQLLQMAAAATVVAAPNPGPQVLPPAVSLSQQPAVSAFQGPPADATLPFLTPVPPAAATPGPQLPGCPCTDTPPPGANCTQQRDAGNW